MGQQRIGQRAATWLPGESGYAESLSRPDTKIDPSTSRAVWFVQEYEDGTWKKFGLLRSLEWIKEQEIEAVGDWVEVSGFDEMGVEGEFQVMAIDPCPTIEPGPGRIITAEFQFSHGVIFELTVSGQDKPIRGTSKHPYWSEDRHDWVPLDELRTGERLLVEGGTAVVLGVDEAGAERVCNFEVDGDHCYRVGASGVLVHNQSAKCNPCDPPNGSIKYKQTEVITLPDGRVRSRAAGGYATITPTSANQSSTFTSDPDWWNLLPVASPSSVNSFVRGHLIAGTFGGAGGSSFYNMVPLFRRANNPGMEQCELRIQNLVKCGYCVTLEVTAKYEAPVSGVPAGVQQMVPNKVTMTIVADKGTGTSVIENVTIDVINTPSAAAVCMSRVTCT